LVEPAGISRASVGDQGPSGAPAKAAAVVLEERVTVTGLTSGRITPASWRLTVSGPLTLPARDESGALAKANVAVDQDAKSCQLSLNQAPSSALVHHCAPQAAVGASAESWIAAARRSATAPLSIENCVLVSVSGRFGVQANPKCVPAERAAYVCAET
jgi:hypothetical protein